MRFLNLFLTLADPWAANNSCHIRLYCSFIPGIQVLLRGKNAEELSAVVQGWATFQSCATNLSDARLAGA